MTTEEHALVTDVMSYAGAELVPLLDVMKGHVPRAERPDLHHRTLFAMMRHALGDTAVGRIKIVGSGIDADTRLPCRRSLERTFSDALDHALGFRMLTRLGRDLYGAISRRFGRNEVVSLVEALRYDPLPAVRKNVLSTLMYYYAAQVGQDRPACDRLLPLLRAMPWIVPVGEEKGRTGTWIMFER